MPLYTSENDVNLLRDILLQSGKLYAKKYYFLGKGTMGTPGAAAVVTLTGATMADDAYNGYQLFIVDDDSKLSYVDIDDTVANTSITVDTTSTKLTEDDSTAGSFTASAVYDLYILGTELFFGYSDQQLDFEESRVQFETGEIPAKIIREDTIRIVLGFSGNLRSLGADPWSEIYGLTQFGSQTNQKQYHGGSAPAVRPFWALSLRMDNVNGQQFEVAGFKTLLYPNGPVNFNEEAYKVTPYQAKFFIDTLRDTDKVNSWKIRQVV